MTPAPADSRLIRAMAMCHVRLLELRNDLERRIDRTSESYETIARAAVDGLDRILADTPPQQSPRTIASARDPRALMRACDYARIEDAVAEVVGVPVSVVRTRGRSSWATLPRHIVWFVCREQYGNTLTEIGKIAGGYDHCTIHHGVARIASLLHDKDALVTAAVEAGRRATLSNPDDDSTELPPVTVAALVKAPVDELVKLAAAEWQVPEHFIVSRNRARSAVAARRAVAWVAHRTLRLPLNYIARHGLERPSHSSILDMVKQMDAAIASDHGVAERVQRLASAITDSESTDA